MQFIQALFGCSLQTCTQSCLCLNPLLSLDFDAGDARQGLHLCSGCLYVFALLSKWLVFVPQVPHFMDLSVSICGWERVSEGGSLLGMCFGSTKLCVLPLCGLVPVFAFSVYVCFMCFLSYGAPMVKVFHACVVRKHPCSISVLLVVHHLQVASVCLVFHLHLPCASFSSVVLTSLYLLQCLLWSLLVDRFQVCFFFPFSMFMSLDHLHLICAFVWLVVSSLFHPSLRLAWIYLSHLYANFLSLSRLCAMYFVLFADPDVVLILFLFPVVGSYHVEHSPTGVP